MMSPGGMHLHHLSAETQKADNVWATLRRMARYMKPFKGILLFASLLIIIETMAAVYAPRLIGRGVDIIWGFIGNNTGFEEAARSLNLTMLILLGVYLGQWAVTSGERLVMVKVGQVFLYNIRQQIFQKVQELSLSYFDRTETGDIMSRQTNDTQVINRIMSHGLLRFVGSIFTLVGILISMVMLNWRLALVTFSILPMMFISTVFFSGKARRAYRRTRRTIGKVSAELEENIVGVKVAQAFSRQQENIASFRNTNETNREANVTAESITAAFSPTLDVLSTIGIAVVIAYGGYLAARDLVTIGAIVAFLQYVRRFFMPVRQIALLWGNIQSAIAGAERIFELLDEPRMIRDSEDAVDLPPIEGRVEFRNVGFEYNEGDPVLKDVSIVAEPGQTVAFVGPTGAGKTTMINLIGRFYDVTDGAVLVDGHDVRSVTRRSLRGQMSLVLQDTFLFSDTIMDNIRYGRLDATDKEVLEAAKLAKAHDFIMKLPDGYETQLTEGASNLSRGQKQLLAIARAILADPRILILDEATSSVDTRTEKLIQEAMGRLLAGRTSFVVAHRLSTIRQADALHVIENGRIVETGTHDELMAKEGTYHHIYMSQFRDPVPGLPVD